MDSVAEGAGSRHKEGGRDAIIGEDWIENLPSLCPQPLKRPVADPVIRPAWVLC